MPRNHPLHQWIQYLDSLDWCRGSLDDSSWKAALRGASLAIAPDLVFETICRLIAQAGDTPKQEKVASQVERAYAFVKGPRTNVCANSGTQALRRQSVKFQPTALKKTAAALGVANVVKFIEQRSPIAPDYVDSAGFLARLYSPGEKVLVFTDMRSQGQVLWDHNLPADQLPGGGHEGVWYLPNPVDGCEHPNPRQGGKTSRRSQESITVFRFAVLESDEADMDHWLRFLALVPLRIVAIYTSGGRSIHALVQVDAARKEDWDAQIKPIKPVLTMVGADPAALTAVRLSRLPQAWRGETQQRLLYLNPQADGVPIRELPVRPYHLSAFQFAQAALAAGQLLTAEEVQAVLSALRPFAYDPAFAAVINHLPKS